MLKRGAKVGKAGEAAGTWLRAAADRVDVIYGGMH